MTAEVLDKFSELIITALGLVAALAWNEAIQQLFTQLLGEAGGALAAKFFYAFLELPSIGSASTCKAGTDAPSFGESSKLPE